MSTPGFGRSTYHELEEDISVCYNILSSLSRSDPQRPARLRYLASLRAIRYYMSGQEEDLNQCITLTVDAILLPRGPSQSSQDVVHGFSLLATSLISRYSLYERSEDIDSSLEYFRHLRYKLHPSGIFRLRLTSNHVRALTHHVMLSNDVGEMEEMADLCRELIAEDDSTSYTRDAIFDFSTATVEIFRRDDTKTNQVPECVIDVLRVATMRKPDWHHVSFALSHCLAIRFQMTHTICYYDEAITMADQIIASCNPGDSLTPTQQLTIVLIVSLITDRLNFHAQPEYLVNSEHRVQSLLRDIPSLPEWLFSVITELLSHLQHMYSDYFGDMSNYEVRELPDKVESEMVKWAILNESLFAICNDEPTDIEETVMYSRRLVPSLHSGDLDTISPVHDLAEFLFEAYKHTSRLDYLNEAIITFRRVLCVPRTNRVLFRVAERLLTILDERWRLFRGRQDFEEMMFLFSEQVKSGSEVAFRRFRISCQWASKARAHTHPCTSDAYENAMSLMQETLVFSPTLQTQYVLLAKSLRDFEGMPLDYASYQIEKMQLEEAVQTLERGRTLLWSEMRGFRTSTDQLYADKPGLAEKFTQTNMELEQVTMSAVRNEEMVFEDNETGDEEMEAFDQLVERQRGLLKERDSLVSQIQTLPCFENFLKPPLFDILNQAAYRGPVIIVNQSTWRSDILIFLKDSPPSVISTPPDLHDRAKALKDRLLRSYRYDGPDSLTYEETLASVLKDLYTLIGIPVIDRLRGLKIPEQSRVWWCPTAAFCSLPLHAMGPIPSDYGEELYFMDLYITSYTTSLSALIESRKHSSRDKTFGIPSILLLAHFDDLPAAAEEASIIRRLPTTIELSTGEDATPTDLIRGFSTHQFAHIVCHGTLEEGKPFNASFELQSTRITLLEIVRSRLPAAEFAFLSACHTAAQTSGSLDEEALHLTAAVQHCGFRSVIGTLWAMADTDGPHMTKYVYQSIFSSRANLEVPYCERSAKALRYAVRKLRRKRGINLERWVNFVHYGA